MNQETASPNRLNPADRARVASADFVSLGQPVGKTATDPGRLVAWPAATIIAVIILVNELLPYVLGTGERAVVDWGFSYVTFRFILLPLASGAHVVVNTGFLVFSRRHPLGKRLIRFGSVVVSMAFLVISYFYPLPLFKGLL